MNTRTMVGKMTPFQLTCRAEDILEQTEAVEVPYPLHPVIQAHANAQSTLKWVDAAEKGQIELYLERIALARIYLLEAEANLVRVRALERYAAGEPLNIDALVQEVYQ